MKRIVVFVLYLFAPHVVSANEAQCKANAGTYLIGSVTGGPTFVPGHARDGIELSHTHLTVRSDQDSQSYDVAIDNVFATGYDAAGKNVPVPLSTIRTGDRLELCGRLYRDGGLGIDWVHTNCAKTPTTAQPNGWLKIFTGGGALGPDVEDSQEYCRLWP
jgi:hypothetical protein